MRILVLLALLLAAAVGAAQQGEPKCKCVPWPYQPDPPCPERCAAKALSAFDATTLTGVVGLSAPLAQSIASIDRGSRPQLLSDYEKRLSASDYRELQDRFGRLNANDSLAIQTAAAALAGAGDATGNTIKVGVLHSLSGTMAISETVLKETVLMAIAELNARGGLLGKRIVPVVVDPASNWPLFAEKARHLITQEKVTVVFGCWTSVLRKSVLPVFEATNSLLFYPAPYVGERFSRNAFYTGAAPNQQAIPAVEYLMSKDGGSAMRFVLLGTDYVYPRTINKIVRAFLRKLCKTQGRSA